MKKLFAIALTVLLSSPVVWTAADREVTIELKGMTCQGCVKAIRSSLLEVPGVKQVTIDLKKGTGQLHIDGNTSVNDDQLKHAVEKAGYSTGAIRWKK